MTSSVYADVADLPVYGLPATALSSLTAAQQQAALVAASALMDSYFRGRYPLPFIAWGIEVRRCCCHIAVADLMGTKGYQPAAGADDTIGGRYAAAIDWLNKVQRSAAHPDVTTSAAQSASYASPKVLTSSAVATNSSAASTTRGW